MSRYSANANLCLDQVTDPLESMRFETATESPITREFNMGGLQVSEL